jgi:flagellum-specific peptidoglycan hydrolase FlgJ
MTALEARLHLELAYRAVVVANPAQRTLSLLMAQWALETARGHSMWGYNFGGIKASTRGTSLSTREAYGERARRSIQAFRSYSSASEGAMDYIRTLASDFPRAFSELHGGDADRFARALADEGYFTGNPSEYRRAIVLLANEYERKWSA